jgi:hypothetical protein
MGSTGGERRCFVISPIGAEDSEVRKHADTVFKYIVKPAMEACGVVAVRSDQIATPGLISTEMYKHILNDDVCAVVLTGMNPNVFYELAIAHAAARPVVLLIRKGETPPFDIKDHRYVEYDLGDVDALIEGKYADLVKKQVTYLLESDERPVVSFDQTLSPLGIAERARLTREEADALQRFFGVEVLEDQGITVTLPIYHPLTMNAFVHSDEITQARKTDENREEIVRPIYADVLHFDDYRSAQELADMLRDLGVSRVDFEADSAFLGHWDANPCVICLGSPFVNAALGELGKLSEDTDSAWVSGTRSSPTLDTYRVVIRKPQPLTLGVDETHALGVIARLANPSSPSNSVIGIWGCRAESTHATARYLRRSFKKITGPELTIPTVVLLAVRGQNFSVIEPMYSAADEVIERNDDLLRWYLRPETTGDALAPANEAF